LSIERTKNGDGGTSYSGLMKCHLEVNGWNCLGNRMEQNGDILKEREKISCSVNVFPYDT
jgi:hypothetical protein